MCVCYDITTLMHSIMSMLNFSWPLQNKNMLFLPTCPLKWPLTCPVFPTPTGCRTLTFWNAIWNSQIATWNSITLGIGTSALSRAVSHTAVFDGDLASVQDDILTDQSSTRMFFFLSITRQSGALLLSKTNVDVNSITSSLCAKYHSSLRCVIVPTLPIPGHSLTFDPALSRHGGTGGGESCRAALKPSV